MRQQQGELPEALRYYEDVLKIYRALAGDVHPAVADTLWNMANVLEAMDRQADAKPLYSVTVAIYKRVFDPTHSKTLRSEAAVSRLEAAGF